MLGDDALIVLTWKDIMVFGVTVPLLIALTWIVQRTSMGRSMRAVAQDPNNAHALADYGMALGRLDRPDEGVEQIRTAMWLSPKHPLAYLWHYFLADVELRNPEQALIEINRSLALFEHQPAFAVKTFALMCLARVEEAKAAMRRMRALYPRITLEEMEEQVRRGTSHRADLRAPLVGSIRQAWD